MNEVKMADFASLRIAREDRVNITNPVLSRGEQLADAMVEALISCTANNALTKHIAARALGRMAVQSVR